MTIENCCMNSLTGKHRIWNNTASMRYNGTCGACQLCTGMFSPKECFEALNEGHFIDENLKMTLIRYGYQIKGFWLCATCGQPFPDSQDRLAHFNANH